MRTNSSDIPFLLKESWDLLQLIAPPLSQTVTNSDSETGPAFPFYFDGVSKAGGRCLPFMARDENRSEC